MDELNGEFKVLAERLDGVRNDISELKAYLKEAVTAGSAHRQELDRRLTAVETEIKHFNLGDLKSSIATLQTEISTRPTFKQILVGVGMIMIPVVAELIVGAMILVSK